MSMNLRKNKFEGNPLFVYKYSKGVNTMKQTPAALSVEYVIGRTPDMRVVDPIPTHDVVFDW